MIEEQETTITLGLPKKNETNDIDFYKEMKILLRPHEPRGSEFLIEQIVTQIKEHPELYFNFGFTYNDFKAFLMKMVHARSVRNFIEKKRLEKIDEYNEKNNGGLQGNFQGASFQ